MESVIPLFALVYVGIGVLFGLFFAAKGAALLDPVADGAPVGFRILVMPGAAALWPILLTKLLRKSRPATPKGYKGVHLVIWLVLAPLALVGLALGVAARQEMPAQAPPVESELPQSLPPASEVSE